MKARKIFILTLFPEFFRPLVECGVVGQVFQGKRAGGESQFEIHCIQIRDFTFSRYKGVDDTPFGGGPGMVMRADVLKNALLKGVVEAFGYPVQFKEKLCVIYLGPRGIIWNGQKAREFAQEFWASEGEENVRDVVFICGRYEGIDERFLENYVERTYSLGDFILSGGEPALLCLIDSAMRFVPGCLGNALSNAHESFENQLLEYPLYTRPREFEGKLAPDILLSGHHKNIQSYLLKESLRLTKLHRPDLLSSSEHKLESGKRMGS